MTITMVRGRLGPCFRSPSRWTDERFSGTGPDIWRIMKNDFYFEVFRRKTYNFPIVNIMSQRQLGPESLLSATGYMQIPYCGSPERY